MGCDLAYLGYSIASFKPSLEGDQLWQFQMSSLGDSVRNESVDAKAAMLAHEIYHAWFWATGRHVE